MVEQASFWRENVSLNQDEMKEKAKLEEEKKDEEKEDPKGIPEFWLTVFKNVDLLSDMLQVGSSRQLLGGSENRSQAVFASSNEKSGFAATCWPTCVEDYDKICCTPKP